MAELVGRQRPLQELEEALAAALDGHGGLALVSGEAGIGKTRVCEELADRAARRQARVLWARCWESGAAPAFWPWQQLARQLGEASLTEVHDGEERDPEVARTRLFEDVVEMLARAATAGPLLVVMDDVHWADPASVRLLAHVAAHLRTMAVLVLATFRELEAPPEVLDLGRRGRHLSLGGLDPAELPAFVRAVIGREPTDAAVAAVHRHTRGNPLFAQELVRLLDTRGQLDSLAPTDEAPPVPATVRAVLESRLSRLSEACRSVLSTGAVVGDEFSLDVVEAVTGVSRPALLESMDEATTARLATEVGVARYAFTHPLWRSALYDALGVAQRVRLHERVGEALEAQRNAGREVDLAALAYHFVKAAPAGRAARAASYAFEAAQLAMDRLAYEDAVGLCQQALAALELDPSGVDRVEVLLGLGRAQVASGDLPGARGAYLRAASLARATGRPHQLALAAIGLGGGGGFEVAVADREQVDLLEEARRALGEEPSALLAWVTARLSVALSLSEAVERRLALSEAALGMARASSDPAVLAYALSSYCDAIAGPADTERRLAAAGEIVELARSMGDRGTELLGRRLRLVALLELGDIAGADVEIDAFDHLSAVIRQPLYRWYVPLWRGMRALMRGDLASAAQGAAEAEDMGASAHSQNAALLSSTLRWYVAREAGRFQEPLAVLDGVQAQEAPLGAQMRVVAALILAEAGRLEEARIRRDADAAAVRALPVDSEWVPVLAQVAQLLGLVGGRSLAEWVYDRLLPYRGRFGVEGIGAVWWGSVERPLGVLAAVLGRREEAAEHFAAALAANRAAGTSLFAARTLWDWGVSLDDPARRSEAVAAYRELGIERGDAGGASAESPAVGDAPAFRREGDVWTLAYRGSVVRLKDVKGLHDLARLLAHPGQEIAATDLAAGVGGAGATAGQGDLGDVVDARAREAYKARLVELERELDDADAAGDAGRSALAQRERDALMAQLSAAFGIGGRPRKAGRVSERARGAVTWRIRDALGRIESAHPELGRHLRRSVRTGTYCAYDPAEPVHWSL